jgi:ABC-type nitrate/sulfonate/bicarbonate transport system substrate-binding protein
MLGNHQPPSLPLLARRLVLGLAMVGAISLHVEAQERRTRVRISNAGLTITALPLLAARDWGTFIANGLDAEIIVISPPVAAAAMAQGDIDYVAGVGPASVAATLSGLPSRAIWFSSERITYWLMARPQFKSLESLKGKKVAISGGVGGTNHVAFVIALEKLGANPKDYVVVGIQGQELQILASLDSGFVDAAVVAPPITFKTYKSGYNKLLDIGSMVEMPGGGLTALIKTIQSKPAEVKKVIHSLQLAKDEIRKSKQKTIELIMRLLKMDKEIASETYDTFLTTLSPTGIPNRTGMNNLIRSLQTQGRFSNRKIAFTDVADDRLAMEVAKEMGYKLPQ